MMSRDAFGLHTGLTAACEDLGIPASRIRAHRSIGDVFRNQMLFEKHLDLNPPENDIRQLTESNGGRV